MARKGKQFDFFDGYIPSQFGGMLLKGNAKVARPLSTKHAIHLVLKSKLATGSRSFLSGRNVDRIEQIVRRTAGEKGIKIYRFVNVGNHLHVVFKLKRATPLAGRRAFHAFIRAVSGLIARHVLGAERGRAKRVKFWQARPFTRLVTWGRDYNFLRRYMAKNSDQARIWRALVDWGFSVIDPAKIARLNTS